MTYLRRRKIQNLDTVFIANTSSQTISTTVLDVSNSEITFTPPTGNFNFVVFEYTVQYHNDPDNNNNLNYELQEKIGAGSYSALGSGYRVQEITRTVQYQSTITGRFMIPIYSGSRTYKLTMRVSTTNREVTLHETNEPQVYSPIYQMYCI